jgi:hypothetical protein
LIVQDKKSQYGFELLSSWSEKVSVDESGGLSMVTTAWFLNLYVNIMPPNSVLRIWDCLFYHKRGEKILFRVAMALLHLNERKIRKFNDISDAWSLLKCGIVWLNVVPNMIVNIEEFICLCYKPHKVSTVVEFGRWLFKNSKRKRISVSKLFRIPSKPFVISQDYDKNFSCVRNAMYIQSKIGSLSGKQINIYRESLMKKSKESKDCSSEHSEYHFKSFRSLFNKPVEMGYNLKTLVVLQDDVCLHSL